MQTLLVVESEWSKDARQKAQAKGMKVTEVRAEGDPPIDRSDFRKSVNTMGRVVLGIIGVCVVIGGISKANGHFAEPLDELTGAIWAVFGALVLLLAK
ncbi:MAG: hypothetical protein ACF8NJ_01960 [Phycisphaerales bacterium JB038]